MLELIFAAVVFLLALAWRWLFLPPDAGGLFFQSFCCGLLLVLLAGAALDEKGRQMLPRWLMLGLVLPVGGFVVLAAPFFAVQALFPYLVTVGLLIGTVLTFRQKRRGTAALLLSLAGLLAVWDASALRHMLLVQRLRHLEEGALAGVNLESLEAQKAAQLHITDPGQLSRVARALEATFPYSPNHEGIREPWKFVMRLKDGGVIVLKLGRGHRENPSTVWIEFANHGVYQNAELYRVLTSEPGVHLWAPNEQPPPGPAKP